MIYIVTKKNPNITFGRDKLRSKRFCCILQAVVIPSRHIRSKTRVCLSSDEQYDIHAVKYT